MDVPWAGPGGRSAAHTRAAGAHIRHSATAADQPLANRTVLRLFTAYNPQLSARARSSGRRLAGFEERSLLMKRTNLMAPDRSKVGRCVVPAVPNWCRMHRSVI